MACALLDDIISYTDIKENISLLFENSVIKRTWKMKTIHFYYIRIKTIKTKTGYWKTGYWKTPGRYDEKRLIFNGILNETLVTV